MTAINFPSSPSNGDTHTVGGVTYTYNSAETKWKTTINSNAFLPLTGGTLTGNFTLPAGTTEQRPGSPSAGSFRYNSTTGSTEFYNGTVWINTNLIPNVSSVSGPIYAGAESTLTISATNATDVISVVFKEGSTTLATVTDVSISGSTYSVTVPSAVYGQTAGDTIAVSIINSDGAPSNNSVNKTVTSPPTGGTVTTSGSYRIHTFTSSQSGANGFVVPTGTTLSNVEYLVIAGGGGGGAYGGGGGAGGYRCSVVGESSGGGGSAETRLSLSAGQYDIVVGAGGSAGLNTSSGYTAGGDGGNSSFSTITSTGGGGGGYYNANDGRDGGSGGGGGIGESSVGGAGGSGTTGQGFAGGEGRGRSGIYLGGGGGGGAGEAGDTSPAGNETGGDGGNGVASSITGSSVTRAGGGGGKDNGNGGTGGGGDGGSNSVTSGSGTTNTGSGGGSSSGEQDDGTGAQSGQGGSGVVIIRYQP